MVDTQKSILLARRIPLKMHQNSAVDKSVKNCSLVVTMSVRNYVTLETALIVPCYHLMSPTVPVDKHHLLINLELYALIQLLPVIKSAANLYHVVLQITIMFVNKNAIMDRAALARKLHMYDAVAKSLRKISHVLRHLSSMRKILFYVKNVAIKKETVANTNVHSHVVCELCMIVNANVATCSLVDSIDVSALVTVVTVLHVC